MLVLNGQSRPDRCHLVSCQTKNSLPTHGIATCNLSRLIWTPLKLVPPGTNSSEIFGPTLKNLFLL